MNVRTRTANEGSPPLEMVGSSDAHDAWFRAKVLQALKDTGPDVEDADAEARFGERRALAVRKAGLATDELVWAQYALDDRDAIFGYIQALEFFGGAPALLVPDNAMVAIIKACYFDPQVNRTYCAMAAHYGSAVMPTRPRRPRDKAKVEAAVRIIERWLLRRLRHRTFYSLAEVNAAIVDLLHDLNDKRVLRRVGVTRRQLFGELYRPALRPLPVERNVFAEWRIRRAGLDYHVESERHYYSVPYRFAREQVEARITAHRGSSGNGKHTTIPDHMPSAHRRFADWTIERIQREASAMGPDVALLCERILADRPHPVLVSTQN